MTRIKIEMEVDAEPVPHEDAWKVELPAFYLGYGRGPAVKVSGIYCTVVGAEEPTESGYYKITFAGTDTKDIVFRSNRGNWFHTGSSRGNTWQELGNIVAVEKIEL